MLSPGWYLAQYGFAPPAPGSGVLINSPAELTTIVAKILAYEQNRDFGPWRQRVNFIAGVGGFSPMVDTVIETATSKLLTSGITHMFTAALEIAAPLAAVLFCTDLALGLLNRIAPALNAFSLGFPAKIFLVLSLGGLAIGMLPRAIHSLVIPAVEAVVTVAK